MLWLRSYLLFMAGDLVGPCQPHKHCRRGLPVRCPAGEGRKCDRFIDNKYFKWLHLPVTNNADETENNIIL